VEILCPDIRSSIKGRKNLSDHQSASLSCCA
ncbi:MAG: hypothetical protein ACI8UC_001158, partial [Psychromonas sp.]